MQTLPTGSYNGLTIILAEPSRFDKNQLLTGYAGDLVKDNLGVTLANCFVTDKRSFTQYPSNTKAVLHLGDTGMLQASVQKMRGHTTMQDGLIHLCTFAPQDVVDRKNYFGEDAEDDEDEGNEKDRTKYKRKHWRFWFRKDLSKITRLLQGSPKINKCNYHQYLLTDDICRLLGSVTGGHLYLDIETSPRDVRISCFSFSWDRKDVYTVPMFYNGEYYYGDTHKILLALAKAMASNTVVIHNSAFDLFVFSWRYGLPIAPKVYDTMLAHHRCLPEIEKSLAACLSLYTDQPYHKDDNIFEPKNRQQLEQLMLYNAKDVESLVLIKEEIDNLATKLDAHGSIRQANESIPHYLRATIHGFRVDTVGKDNQRADNERLYAQYLRCLRLLTGKDEFNPNSSQQVAAYLYDELGCEPYRGERSTEEKILLQLQLKYNIPSLKFVIKSRFLKKESGQLKYLPSCGRTFRDYNKEQLQFRVTTSWNISGTETFRLASRKHFILQGTNLQNQPIKLREFIIPDEGKIFVQCDQSGAEALIVSFLTSKGRYRELFECGIKSHVFVALHVFQKQFENKLGRSLAPFIAAPIGQLRSVPGWEAVEKCIKESDSWSGGERYYYIAKKICHASNYGMKAPTFRMEVLKESEGLIVLSLAEAQAYLDAYHRLFPEIRVWHSEVESQVRRTRLLRNLFGYPRVFTGPMEHATFKSAYAFVPQSTVATITNLAFTELSLVVLEPQWAGVDVLGNCHDSVLLQCPIGMEGLVKELTMKHMNRKLLSPRGEIFYMKSEAKEGLTWKAAK